MALLAAQTGEGGNPIAVNESPSWTGSAVLDVDTAGTVTSVKVLLHAISSVGTATGYAELHNPYVGEDNLVATGTFDPDLLPDIPDGPTWVTISLSDSPLVTAEDTVQLRINIVTESGGFAVWWDGEGNEAMWELHGTELSTPTKATNPTPSDTNADVTLDQATITWEDGGGADTYNVYYGTTSGDLGDAVSSAQAGASFTVTDITNGSPYDYLTTRYWRIDSTNNVGTTTGDEWSFTTIRAQSPKVTYLYNNEYYQLLIQDNGTYGDHPADGGVEDTDYVVVTYEPNFIRSNIKLISAANNSIWFEDTI